MGDDGVRASFTCSFTMLVQPPGKIVNCETGKFRLKVTFRAGTYTNEQWHLNFGKGRKGPPFQNLPVDLMHCQCEALTMHQIHYPLIKSVARKVALSILTVSSMNDTRGWQKHKVLRRLLCQRRRAHGGVFIFRHKTINVFLLSPFILTKNRRRVSMHLPRLRFVLKIGF